MSRQEEEWSLIEGKNTQCWRYVNKNNNSTNSQNTITSMSMSTIPVINLNYLVPAAFKTNGLLYDYRLTKQAEN